MEVESKDPLHSNIFHRHQVCLYRGVFNLLSEQAGLGSRRGLTILGDAEASEGG